MYRLRQRDRVGAGRRASALQAHLHFHQHREAHAVALGGGGWGDPLERDTAAVLEDLADGKVTPEAAWRDYGVCLEPGGRRLDEAATRARRAELREARNAA